jgi:hypothetical protein
MKCRLLIFIFLALSLSACAKKPITAPVPGSIDTVDAWAFRIVSDSQAALHSVKTWQQCTVLGFPATVSVDGTTQVCDPKSGAFPSTATQDLNLAIQVYNVAEASGQAYHAGRSQDITGLTTAVNQLAAAISSLLTKTGGK